MSTSLVGSVEVQGLTTSTLSSLRAVEVLAFGRMTSGEVARRLGVHSRTARRVLAQLEGRDWVRRIEGARPEWELNARVLALASLAAHEALRDQVAIGLVDDLCEETRCPVYAVIPCYDAVCCVADSRHGVDMERGDLAPALENVGGVALLAYRSRWCEQNLRLARAATEQWAARLKTTRANGYATAYADHEVELAFPVSWRDDAAVAALVLGDVPVGDFSDTVERAWHVLREAGRCVPPVAG